MISAFVSIVIEGQCADDEWFAGLPGCRVLARREPVVGIVAGSMLAGLGMFGATVNLGDSEVQAGASSGGIADSG